MLRWRQAVHPVRMNSVTREVTNVRVPFRQPRHLPVMNRGVVAILCGLAIAALSLGFIQGRRALANEYSADEYLVQNESASNASSVSAYFNPPPTAEYGGENWVQDTLQRGGLSHNHNQHHVDVPEPLLFDLVRPLGARKGEFELNTLAIFPWSGSNSNIDDDPFGPSPTTFDKRGIEWAPEIEYAIADNFAIEFELPFEESTLEEYKLGLQWTIGTAFDNRYIHGFQVLIQPTSAWENWNSTLLYLAGVRFDETWSGLLMVGGRMDLEGPSNSKTFERLINASIFADLNASTRVGLETNYAAKVDGTAEFIVVPQVHFELQDHHFQLQSGIGLGVFSEGSEQSFILRVIYNN
jgi:hypothetical protein